MSELAVQSMEQRVLIYAPLGRDAALAAAALGRDGVSCVQCRDIDQLESEFHRGAAAILSTEEAFSVHQQRLVDLVDAQADWSDIPVLLLTRRGADSLMVRQAMEQLGNVTLLERPVRIATLASAVRSALRARNRQYQIRAHLAERQQADERKDHFLATLAHELRSPLAPIGNSVNLLRLSGQAPVVVCEMIERQLRYMVRLVDDLMEVSRITRGTIELRLEPIEVETVIGVAIETSRPLIDAANHTLEVTQADEALWIDADPTRMAQVFANLLNNAAKYTDPGGRIAVDIRRDRDSAVVTVSDDGIGIPAHALSSVFDMFAQAEKGARAHSGLGIGLTLARSLVEMHRGTITATSAGAGQGSRFEVRLPLSQQQARQATRQPADMLGRLKPQRVLVVDDNHDSADSLGALLQLIGADVRVVYDGQSALTALHDFDPRVIVLDLGMPGMDGYEVAREIRRQANSEGRMLIALTGWGQEKDRRRTAAAGFDHHLVKPVEFSAMQALFASLQ